MFLQFAGTDTTSHSLIRLAVALAQYPEWHEALWVEQQRLIEEFGPDIDRRVRAHLLFSFELFSICYI